MASLATSVVELAGQLGAWTGVVAVAFREGDERLLQLIDAYPDLADELLAGFVDGEISGESALVILLAYFDVLDGVITGEEDGEISLDDLNAMLCNTNVPPYVSAAAAYLVNNPQLFMLVESMNDGMETARDIAGGNGDGKISVEDIETFLAFNDQLAVLEQNFDAFDTAANPDGDPDGQISTGDLEALADGEGELAEAAQWLLDHSGAYARLSWYQAAKEGFVGERTGEYVITPTSLVLLTVDQQVYADNGNQAGSFVDRRFESLMGETIGHLAAPQGMTAVFDTALTASDQRAALMDRVITEVADDGTIHNVGLPIAFANGAANNMGVIDDRINALAGFGAGDAIPDDLRQRYQDTYTFLGETSRYPDAAERLRVAVHDYGMSEVAAADDSGPGRDTRLRDLGRIDAFLNDAQADVMTDEALADLREATESQLGPSIGSITDYSISHFPPAATVNDIADGMGISAGDGLDWLMTQLGVDSPDAFEALDEAERVARAREAESALNRAVWLVNDRYASDPALQAAAAGQPFVDASGRIKDDMTEEEAQAFREWATSMVAEGGPLVEDYDPIGRGASEIETPLHGVPVEEPP